MKKFLSYLVAGGLATLVEWTCYWIFRNSASMRNMAAVVFALVISTFSNWLFGRLITFRRSHASSLISPKIILEILQVYMASMVGLGLNVFIMWLLHGQRHIPDMLSKMIATGIVFLYNYFIRILVIYREK